MILRSIRATDDLIFNAVQAQNTDLQPCVFPTHSNFQKSSSSAGARGGEGTKRLRFKKELNGVRLTGRLVQVLEESERLNIDGELGKYVAAGLQQLSSQCTENEAGFHLRLKSI